MIYIGGNINTNVFEELNEILDKKDAASEKRLLDIAEYDIKHGVTYMGINAGSRVKTEPEDVEWMLRLVQKNFDIPICIDSPNPDVFKLALEAHDDQFGKPIVNSISAEKERLEKILPLVKEYDTEVVGLLMSDDGIPTEEGEKLACAESILSAMAEVGVGTDSLFMDPLLFPVSVDAGNGMNFINMIKRLKLTYPDIKTFCGLANISHGLPVRELINHTFVAMAAGAGLDACVMETSPVQYAALKTMNLLQGNDMFAGDYLASFRKKELDLYAPEYGTVNIGDLTKS